MEGPHFATPAPPRQAIKRRRVTLRETEGPQFATPAPQQAIQQREQIDQAAMKSCVCPPSVAKILLNILSSQKVEDSECLTPRRKLFNCIDTVGKAVTEELEKLKKTPKAQGAVRAAKIQTLMTMR